MKSGDFIYDMKKKKYLKKLFYIIDLVLQNSQWRNWGSKKCDDMHLCLNLNLKKKKKIWSLYYKQNKIEEERWLFL